jgi:3-deoxy-D-manno-octulosonate 8-phosphate phosphatase (KDO 8-P phosphatase)
MREARRGRAGRAASPARQRRRGPGAGRPRRRPATGRVAGRSTRARAGGPLPIEGPVRIVFLDLDGTLTDGVITYDTAGDQRHFSIRDGLALQWARDLGVLPVVISGRGSKAAELRLEDLGIERYLGVKDKVAVAEDVLRREDARWEQCVMVGDDLPDVPLLKRVGWPVAVPDAVPEVRAVARAVTRARAGHGAVREVVERVLRHNGVWSRVLQRYEVT